MYKKTVWNETIVYIYDGTNIAHAWSTFVIVERNDKDGTEVTLLFLFYFSCGYVATSAWWVTYCQPACLCMHVTHPWRGQDTWQFPRKRTLEITSWHTRWTLENWLSIENYAVFYRLYKKVIFPTLADTVSSSNLHLRIFKQITFISLSREFFKFLRIACFIMFGS